MSWTVCFKQHVEEGGHSVEADFGHGFLIYVGRGASIVMAMTLLTATQPTRAPATTICFAFGSNMHTGRMADRCPTASVLGRGSVEGWTVRIDARGVATIDHAPGATVHGVLWTLEPEDERALDRYEGVRGGYYRRHTLTVHGPTGPTDALVYIGADLDVGPPRPGYLEIILDGAKAAGLPAAYIRHLATLADPR